MLVVVDCFVEANIVVCSNIRCQIYFGKKLFICSFNRIYSRSKTLFRQNQLTLEQIKSNQVEIIFEKDQQLLITVCGHVLTGQSQEKQIEGRKNRRTWSPTQRSGSNLRRVGTTHKTRSRIWLKQIFVLDSMFIFKEEECRLRCLISKTLVLPQYYFTQILPLVMAETICSPMCGARIKTTPD